MRYTLLVSKALVKPQNRGRGPAASESDEAPQKRLPSLQARMRTRRSQLGLTGAELAQRAGISPSYVSLIESGAKTPDEGVAAGLARALGDDEALYRAWARAARLGLHDLELLNQLDVISRTPAYMELVESGEELPARLEPPVGRSRASEGANDLTARLREVAYRIDSGKVRREPALVQGESVLRIPVLPRRAEPGGLGSSEAPGAIRAHVLVDPGLLAGHEPERLFACEVTPRDMKHLRGIAAPGDLVVLLRGGSVAPDRICAVRAGDGIVLARVILKDRSLLLLPGEGEHDFESLEVRGAGGLADVMQGTQALLIRR